MPSFTVFKGNDTGYPKKTTTTKPDELKGDSVLVKVTASGLCGTDLHYLKGDMVIGHEGVGVVQAVGPDAKSLKVGDRIGWGYETDSCGNCGECLSGHEIFCAERNIYGGANFDQGSFASHAIWREAFLHKIPDNISDTDAAPLQCAGATVFTTLQGTSPGDTIGVMGVGGLGHVAIQYANKLGLRVVVFSGSDSKKQQAFDLGAHEFIATNGATELKTSAPINRLLVTTSAQPNWELILPTLAPRATVYPLSVSDKPFEFPYMPLILSGINVQGSLVATRDIHRKMLDFASLHNIKPIVEKYPMTEEGIKTAIDRLSSGKVVFRAVLTN